MITRLPAAPVRVPTGPLKIGDAWCGFYLRGDDALTLREILRCTSSGFGLAAELYDALAEVDEF